MEEVQEEAYTGTNRKKLTPELSGRSLHRNYQEEAYTGTNRKKLTPELTGRSLHRNYQVEAYIGTIRKKLTPELTGRSFHRNYKREEFGGAFGVPASAFLANNLSESDEQTADSNWYYKKLKYYKKIITKRTEFYKNMQVERKICLSATVCNRRLRDFQARLMACRRKIL